METSLDKKFLSALLGYDDAIIIEILMDLPLPELLGLRRIERLKKIIDHSYLWCLKLKQDYDLDATEDCFITYKEQYLWELYYESKRLDKMIDLPEDFIERNKDNLSWWYIMRKQKMTTEFINTYMGTYMDLWTLVENNSITYDMIYKYDLNFFTKPKLAEHIILSDNLMVKLGAYKDKISKNPSLTSILIRKYLHQLNFEYLSSNMYLPLDIIDDYVSEIHWDLISTYHILSLDFIDRYKDKLIWKGLASISNNKTITSEIIVAYADKLDFYYVSKAPHLSSIILDLFKYKLVWALVSENIVLDDVMVDAFYPYWDWVELSNNKTLTPNIIDKYWKKFNWSYLSKNQVLTETLIDKYLNESYGPLVSDNKGLTPNSIRKYAQDLNKTTVYGNPATISLLKTELLMFKS